MTGNMEATSSRPRRGLLVLGMHRSGTSAVGRLLSLLGVDYPNHTIGPDEFNPSGYWESADLYRLHDQILTRAGSCWDDWQPFDRTALDRYDAIGIEHALREFLVREFSDSSFFFIKDPRICRLVPLWLDVFGSYDTAPAAIIPVRHPFSVAQSLQRRNGFSLAKSSLIWLRHVVDGEYATRHVPRSFVDYDCLLADWRSNVSRIADELGVAWPNPLPDVAEAVDQCLSTELRHHVATTAELEGSPHVVSWIRRAYLSMQAFARAGDNESARREMDQVRAEFDNACLAFGDMWRQEQASFAQAPLRALGVVTERALEENVDKVERQLSTLNTDVLEAVTRVQAVEQPLSGLRHAVELQHRSVRDLQEQAAETGKLVAGLATATSGLSNKLEQMTVTSDRRNATIVELSAVVEEHHTHLSRQVSELKQHVTCRDVDIEALAAKNEEHFAGLHGDLVQLKETDRRHEAAIDELVAKAVDQHASIQQVINAQARRISNLEAAVDALARQGAEQTEIATHIHAHSAKLSRIQFSLEGAIARLDAMSARPTHSRLRTSTKRGLERLRNAGRSFERAVRKVRKEVGRLVRLQTLRNYLARRWFQRTVQSIRTSGLFDTSWYLKEYADVAATGIDPVLHYLKYGVDEGRCPNPMFHTRWYLDQNPDVAAAKANPLLHYLDHGAAEGRDPSPLFQTTAWIAQHPELQTTKQNPLAHYLSRIDATPHEPGGATSGNHVTASLLAICSATTQARLAPSDSDVGYRPQDDFQYSPLISIVVPVYDTPAALLEKMIVSVQRQTYGSWELCLVDDASPQPHVRPLLEQAAARDPRIRLAFRGSNGNISAATNTGIALARGEFIAFLDHDDELTPDALLEVVRVFNDDPDTDVVYTDQDKIDLDDRRSEPFFKPAWSPAYFESVMYVGHLLVVRTSLLNEVGGCDSTFDGVQDFELMLRLGEATKKIRHLPRILYHWRRIPGSIASDIAAKSGIVDLQRKAVQAHLDRLAIKAVATTAGSSHRVRVVPVARSHEPLVSIMVPSKDHPELIGPCLASLFEKTTYKTVEVIVGDNETTDPEALRVLDRYPVTRVPLAGRFCFAAFNNRMAEQARGDYLLLLNNDTEVVQPNWLETLMLYAEQDDVGAVGPLLLYGDGTVQHAGVILGPRGTADHVMRGFPGDSDGYAGSLQAAREVTAVTGACLLVRRDHYVACGGLNETFGRHYEDVDFCLRLRRMGLRNVFVGGARMVHHESKSRGNYYDFTDRVLLLDHWESWIHRGDPYYNPAFDPERVDYSVRVA